MDLAGRNKVDRIGREIGGNQRRDEHVGAVRNRLRRRPGIAAQHLKKLDAILVDQLLRTGSRLVRQVLVVVGDDLDIVHITANLDATVGVDVLGPHFAAIEAGKAPRGNVAGERDQESDFDCLVVGVRLTGSPNAGQCAGTDGCRRSQEFTSGSGS